MTKVNIHLIIIIFMGLFFNSCERKPPRHEFPPSFYFSKDMHPLGYAIYNDDAQTVKRILTEQKISPDTVNKFGKSLLLYAILVSSKHSVKTLLEMGADPNKRCDETDLNSDHIYVTWPIYAAVYHSDPYYVKMLLKYGYNVKKDYPLHATINNAPDQNMIKLLKLFLDKGSNINTLDYLYEPPIIKALNCGRYDAVVFLLDHGADVTIVDGHGWTLAYKLQKRIDGKRTDHSREIYLKGVQPIIDRLKARGVTFPVPKPVIEGETHWERYKRKKAERKEAERKAADALRRDTTTRQPNRWTILDD